MVCASFSILWMKIQLEWHSIIFCSFGGVFGLILGIILISNGHQHCDFGSTLLDWPKSLSDYVLDD